MDFKEISEKLPFSMIIQKVFGSINHNHILSNIGIWGVAQNWLNIVWIIMYLLIFHAGFHMNHWWVHFCRSWNSNLVLLNYNLTKSHFFAHENSFLMGFKGSSNSWHPLRPTSLLIKQKLVHCACITIFIPTKALLYLISQWNNDNTGTSNLTASN